MNEQCQHGLTGLTPELMTSAHAACSPEELLSLAKEHGIPLTPEEAQARFDQLHQTGALADEELENVAGGCGGGGKQPRFHTGDLVYRHKTYNDCIACIEHSSRMKGGGPAARILNTYKDVEGNFEYDFTCAAKLPNGAECGRPINIHFDYAVHFNRVPEWLLKHYTES